MEAYSVRHVVLWSGRGLRELPFGFRRTRDTCEDWSVFGRLAKVGVAAYLNCEAVVQYVHRDSRLTDVADSKQATARIKLLHRVWGEDESFLQKHSHRYQGVLKAQHLRRARYLIKEGKLPEAKEDLRIAGGGPWSYRLLTTLPPFVIRGLIRIRRTLRNRG